MLCSKHNFDFYLCDEKYTGEGENDPAHRLFFSYFSHGYLSYPACFYQYVSATCSFSLLFTDSLCQALSLSLFPERREPRTLIENMV